MLSNFKVFNYSFKCICLVATVIMIVHWFIIFLKNEDVSSVEIKSPDITDDLQQPELNLCLVPPFLQEKITQIADNITTSDYVSYLKGFNAPDPNLTKLEFEKISLNLFNHLLSVGVYFKPGKSNWDQKYCNNSESCPYVEVRNSWNGFTFKNDFWKCYGIKLNKEFAGTIRSVALVFNSNLRTIIQNRNIWAMLSYPNQMLRIDQDGETIWNNLNDTTKIATINIKQVELLRRRDKTTDRCFSHWNDFDDYVIREKIEKVGCRAPYVKEYKNFSICVSRKKIKESTSWWHEFGSKYFPSCHGISSIISYVHEMSSFILEHDHAALGIYITYPDKIKLITQARKVDGQSLIGYIGGYVGLFLGNYKNSNKIGIKFFVK